MECDNLFYIFLTVIKNYSVICALQYLINAFYLKYGDTNYYSDGHFNRFLLKYKILTSLYYGGSIRFSKAIFHISSHVDNCARVHRDYTVCLAACYKTLDGFYRPPSYSDRIAYRGKQEKL